MLNGSFVWGFDGVGGEEGERGLYEKTIGMQIARYFKCIKRGNKNVCIQKISQNLRFYLTFSQCFAMKIAKLLCA